MLQTSKNLALLDGDSSNAQAKGKDTKNIDSKPKENQKSSDGASGSKKKKKFEKALCSYCMRGFHLEISCMKKIIDQMEKLLEQHNIAFLEGARNTDYGEIIEDHDEICHALKASCSKSHAFLIDSRASNHMVASKEPFSSLQLTDGPSIHMGDDTQIQAEGKGSIYLKHGLFKHVLYIPSLDVNLLSVYQITHTSSPK